MPEIIFSKIENENELDILENQKASFENLNFRFSPELIGELKKRLKIKNSFYFFAKNGDEFAGFVALDAEWREKDFLFLREILVNPKFQRQKIGEKLFEKCLDFARAKNQIGVVTETDFENIPMQKLCEKMGFRKWENPEWKSGLTFKLFC